MNLLQFKLISKWNGFATQVRVSLRQAIAAACVLLGLALLASPNLHAQYSTTKFIDPNTFPTDTTSGFYFGQPIATDGTYTAISTDDALWSKTVAGGTPIKLFSIGSNLPSTTTPATYIYGAVAVSDGTVVFNAAGSGIYGIYSIPADGSGPAVRVADSSQVQGTTPWSNIENSYGTYGLFAVAKGTVVFTIGGALYSAGTDGSNLTTLWLSNAQNQGCSTAGQDAELFVVDDVYNPATNGTNFAFAGSSTLSFAALYDEPLGTVDGCNDLITSGLCNICGNVSTLPGQPQPGVAFYFNGITQIDGDYVYFQADAGNGVASGEDYYGIFKVPLAGGAATAVVTNLSQLPLLKNASNGYDEPNFQGYAVNNGRFVFYAGDNTVGGTGQSAFYIIQNGQFVPVFINQTSVDNQCTGNMTGSNSAGLNQVSLSADGHLYFPAEYVTTGPDLNGSCTYSFLRFQPFAYYVVDTTHPLIQAQTTISTTPAPQDITSTTPVTLNISVAAASGASNPNSLVPTGTVTVYYTSPQIYGVQQPATATLDGTGKAAISLGDFDPAQRTFTVAYAGDSNFTQSGSNSVYFDTRALTTLTWAAPSSMTSGSALDSSELDAVAMYNGSQVPGTYVYTPPAGTVLPLGTSTLSVAFTPSDTNDYQPATATTKVYVQAGSGITAPAQGSTLPGPSATFTWSATAGVTGYYLSIGSTGPGSSDIYKSGETTSTSYTYNSLPTNGETIYVRLSTNEKGSLSSYDYTYTAASEAALTAPTNGQTLSGPSQTFTWSAATGAGVQGYWLYLGTTGVGSKNLYDSGETTATSVTLNTLPLNGETLYARIYTSYSGTLVSQDYVLNAAAQGVLSSPTPGSTLPGPSATFSWTAASGSGAQGYWLFLGTTGVGSKNLYDSGEITATSVTVNSLPLNGETIYARVYTSYNGTLEYLDYTYTAAKQALLTTPTPGTTLYNTTITFDWSAATGSGAQGYWLFLGTTGVGSKNIYDSGETTAKTATVNNMPLTGGTIYARIYTSFNGTLVYKDYTYTAAKQAMLTTPTPSTTLSGTTVTFDWSAATGTNVEGYWLFLGTTGVGSKNLYDSGETTALTETVSGLPTSGTVYARVYTSYNGTLVYKDYTYTAQ